MNLAVSTSKKFDEPIMLSTFETRNGCCILAAEYHLIRGVCMQAFPTCSCRLGVNVAKHSISTWETRPRAKPIWLIHCPRSVSPSKGATQCHMLTREANDGAQSPLWKLGAAACKDHGMTSDRKL